MRLLFTADVHGNLAQIRAVLQHAHAAGCDAVLLGGDLCPRRSKLVAEGAARSDAEAVVAQGAWFRTELAPVLRASDVPVVVIFGNSDCRYNYAALKAELEGPRIRFLWNEVVELAQRPGGEPSREAAKPVPLLGFSLVPPSNHKLKDQERFDISESDDRIHRAGQPILAVGVGSSTGTLTELALHDHHATLEQELDAALAKAEAAGLSMADSVWLTHAPPYGGQADLTKQHGHVGSMAIRKAIERMQPLVSLHGHIHETVEESGGRFLGTIGRTVVLAAGNNFRAARVACILVDPARPADAQRLLLPTDDRPGAAPS